MLDIKWMDGDMRNGLTLAHKDPFTTTLDLNWDDVDLKAQTFLIRDPKNHNPLDLPMGKVLYKMLKKWAKEAYRD